MWGDRGLVSLEPYCFLRLCSASTVRWIALVSGSWVLLGLFFLLRVTPGTANTP